MLNAHPSVADAATEAAQSSAGTLGADALEAVAEALEDTVIASADASANASEHVSALREQLELAPAVLLQLPVIYWERTMTRLADKHGASQPVYKETVQKGDSGILLYRAGSEDQNKTPTFKVDVHPRLLILLLLAHVKHTHKEQRPRAKPMPAKPIRIRYGAAQRCLARLSSVPSTVPRAIHGISLYYFYCRAGVGFCRSVCHLARSRSHGQAERPRHGQEWDRRWCPWSAPCYYVFMFTCGSARSHAN